MNAKKFGINTRREMLNKGNSDCLLIELEKLKLELEQANAKIEELDKKLSELEISQKKFKTIFNSAGDGIILMTNKGKIIEINPEIIRLTGIAREELIDKYVFDLTKKFINFSDLPRVLNAVLKMLSGKKIKNFVVNYNNKNIEITTSNLENSNYIVSIFRDISNLNRKTHEVVTEHNHIVDVLENMNDAFVSLDKNWNYTYVNKKAAKIFNYDQVFLFGKNIWEVFPEGIGQPFYHNYHKVMNEKEIIKMEEYYPPYDKWFENTIIPIEDGIAIFFSDVTEKINKEQILKANQQRYQTIFESTGTFTVLVNKDQTVFMANKMTYRTTGYHPEEVIGRKWIEFVAPESLELLVKQNKARFQNQNNVPTEFEAVLISKKGEKRNCIVYVGLIPEFDQSIISILDITELKNSKTALQNSHDLYADLVNSINVGIYRVRVVPDFVLKEETYLSSINSPYEVEIINDRFCEILNINKEDFINNLAIVHDLIIEEDKAEFARKNIEANLNLTRFVFEGRIYINNEVRWLHMESIPRKLANGSVIWTGFLYDMTQQKNAIENLLKSERSYRDIFDFAPLGIYQSRRDGSFINANKKLSEILCYESLDELMQKNLGTDFYFSEDERNKLIAEHEPKGYANNVEVQWKRKDGTPIWISLTSHAIKNKDGITKFFEGFVEDITLKKEFEFNLQKAMEKAEESDKLKSAFLANMSHEIRTPMNGIIGFSELLKEPGLSGEEQKYYIEIIEKSGNRMLNIINDIIDISKIESGLMNISFSDTNINEQIDFIETFFKPEATAKGIDIFIEKTLADSNAIIHTDREKVYQILTNLVKNAIKFTKKGSVKIGYKKINVENAEREQKNFIEFYVQDTGTGIKKEQQKIVFERFRQGSESLNRNYEGAGLGLSISKAFVEMLGGKIWLESQHGVGSVFRFTLPYNHPEIIPEEEKHLEKVIYSEIKKLNILIADDDLVAIELLTIYLESVKKEIISAISGIEVVEIIRNRNDIDLIMMDIKMPGLDGYEATRQIREFNKDVVIVAQTAFALEGDKEKAIESGCNDYISKPIHKDSLIELIQKYFDS